MLSTKPDLSELRALLPHAYASSDKISDVRTNGKWPKTHLFHLNLMLLYSKNSYWSYTYIQMQTHDTHDKDTPDSVLNCVFWK